MKSEIKQARLEDGKERKEVEISKKLRQWLKQENEEMGKKS